ncbi:lipase family protein [Brevibacillus ginsengisoli]|uniref:lipase family protein n=1 Tax=Brevibacillus ginsengisoli TaxID=363854 RepID=UPI003CF95BDD
MRKPVIDRQVVTVATMTYDTILARDGKCVLPKGYQIVAGLGKSEDPRLGIIAQSDTQIVVCFRGTGNWFDIYKDLTLNQIPYPFVKQAGKTHQGFTEMYEGTIRSQLFNILSGLSHKKQLILCGHSMGGAIATLAALDLACNSKFKHPHVYTFGSPRVGNSAFVHLFNKTIPFSYRIANRYDVVPHFPLRRTFQLHYRHVHSLVRISFRQGGIVPNHEMANYYKQVCRMFEKGRGFSS